MSDIRRVRLIKNITKRRRRDEFPLYPNSKYFTNDRIFSLAEFLERIND